MKKFNLQEALAGKPVMTREGIRITRIIHVPESRYNWKVIAITFDGTIIPVTEDGVYVPGGREHPNDLLMDSVTKEGYIAIGPWSWSKDSVISAYVTHAFSTEEFALADYRSVYGTDPIEVKKITWEEK